VFEDRFELSWTSSVPVEPTIVEGGEEASGGWIATSLGVRERAPRLVLDFAVPYNRVVLLTVLADRSRAASGRRTWFQTPVALQGDAVLGLTVRGRGWDDRVLCAPGGRTIEWQGLETDASLALVRVAEKRAIESRMIDGTRLHVREDALANGMAPLQFAGAVL
jgi:hypothetical protein